MRAAYLVVRARESSPRRTHLAPRHVWIGMHARPTELLLGLIVAGSAIVGCGDANESATQDADARQATAGVTQPTTRVVARDARLPPGSSDVRMLRIPRVGRLLVTCDGEGRTTTASVALQSAPFTAGIQRAQISAFAKAQVPVATLSVAARQLDPDEYFGCAISAQATVFQSTAGTITSEYGD